MEKNLNEKINDKLDDWMSKLNHFQMQFSLGKMEAKEEFEKQKKNIHNHLNELEETVDKLKTTAKEKAEKIKDAVGNYKNELKKTEAANEEVINKHKDAVSKLIQDLKKL